VTLLSLLLPPPNMKIPLAINIPSDVMIIITTAVVGLKSELVERGF
jgi:hypothetical protein